MNALFQIRVYTVGELNAANPNALRAVAAANRFPAEWAVIRRLISSETTRDLIWATVTPPAKGDEGKMEVPPPAPADNGATEVAPPLALASTAAPPPAVASTAAPPPAVATAVAPLASATQHAIPEPNTDISAA